MKLLYRLTPPILIDAVMPLKRRLSKPKLFAGDSAMFERLVRQAQVYGEYGVGASTDWVYENTQAKIVAVETSAEWFNRVSADKDPARLSATLVDVGPVGRWGRPINYSRRENFAAYCEAIWKGPQKPDFVLIDGRFRVACFLTSLLNAAAGTTIVFDDYSRRGHYHVIEEILQPFERASQQVAFRVPEEVDKRKVEALLDQFRFVMD